MIPLEHKTIFKADKNIHAIYKGNNFVWPLEAPKPADYTEPFYVENTGWTSKPLSIVKSDSAAITLTIEYSSDRTNWQTLGTTSTTPLRYSVDSLSKIWLRCKTNYWGGGNINYNNTINWSDKIGGNIMSLLYGSEFTGEEMSFPAKVYYLFNYLFNNSTITDASELKLPAIVLTDYCYYGMFNNCTKLVKAPTMLPATLLANYCYQYMFNNCTSLTTAPELPAITLQEGCYSAMFYGCTSLVTAPELPATTLAQSCYYDMFEGCTNLLKAPELPATTLADSCYESMFRSCTSLTTAPELPATTLMHSCYGLMFYGCTSLITAPALPATTLAEYCYDRMFYGCTNLTTAPTLSATTLKEGCYNAMFHGCTSLVTAPELPATTLKDLCYNHMFYDCTNLNYVKCLATTNININNATLYWLQNVSSTGTFVKKSGATWPTATSGIPSNWTVEEV